MIHVIGKAVVSFGTKLLMSLASEKLIKWAFFKIATEIAKSTKTKADDEFLDKVKQAYEENN